MFAELISPGSSGSITPSEKGCEDGYAPNGPCRFGNEPLYPTCVRGPAPPT